MMMPESVLVTGATGCVGPRVVNALHAAGNRVRTLSLDAPSVGLMPTDVEVRIGDITDESTVKSATEGMQAVIHLAALLHVSDPTPSMRKQYERINVYGTDTVVNAAVQAGVRRIVFFSTIAVYGPSSGQVFSEDNPTCADTLYTRTKLDAEKIVLGTSALSGERIGTVLRYGAIYGARIKGNYQQLAQALARGPFIPIGKGLNRRTLIYDKDAAEAALLAMNHPAAAGKVYNVSDGQFHTVREIVTAICQALNREPPCLSLPVGPARWMVEVLDGAARLIGCKLSFAARLHKYTEDVAVSSKRFQTELDFKPSFDLISGWREAVTEMRQIGAL